MDIKEVSTCSVNKQNVQQMYKMRQCNKNDFDDAGGCNGNIIDVQHKPETDVIATATNRQQSTKMATCFRALIRIKLFGVRRRKQSVTSFGSSEGIV